MKSIWKHTNWPLFTFSKKELEHRLIQFEGAFKETDLFFSLLNQETKKSIIAESLSKETLTSSLIEGIELHRDSVISSISKHLGLEKISVQQIRQLLLLMRL